jgi:hypothetical protein
MGSSLDRALVKRRDELRQELVETFLKILPYERSRLPQSKVDATTTSTTFVRPDLSGLRLRTRVRAACPMCRSLGWTSR